MMQRISTHSTVKRIRVAADLEPALIAKMDRERQHGLYSRATIIRMALIARYRKQSRRGAR